MRGLMMLAMVGCAGADPDPDQLDTDTDTETTDTDAATPQEPEPEPEPGGADPPEPDTPTEEQLQDGGFELGSPNPSWATASSIGEDPICSRTLCEEFDLEPYRGDHRPWLGGGGAEVASVTQTLSPGPCPTTLSLYHRTPSSSGDAGDRLRVRIGDTTVWEADATTLGSTPSWTLVEIDLTSHATGAEVALTVEGETVGSFPTSTPCVDELSLTGCAP